MLIDMLRINFHQISISKRKKEIHKILNIRKAIKDSAPLFRLLYSTQTERGEAMVCFFEAYTFQSFLLLYEIQFCLIGNIYIFALIS